jgi:hypothetical protein
MTPPSRQPSLSYRELLEETAELESRAVHEQLGSPRDNVTRTYALFSNCEC